jgi:glycosyltransferase involved in cell wall biosynthesis
MHQKISIIIPTYTAVEYLDICLKSIEQNQVNQDNEIVVVVDGTHELNKHIIAKYSEKLNIKTVIFDENRGFAEAINHGFYNATNDLCLCINDDNVCPHAFDEVLVKEWENQQQRNYIPHLLLTPNQIEPSPSIFKPFIIQDFGDIDKFDLKHFTNTEHKFLRGYGQVRGEGWTFPIFLKRETFIAVGGFDISYQSNHVSDWDFFTKLEKMGCVNMRIYCINFYHFGSKSARTPESYQKEQDAHKYFQYKWGFRAYNRLL